MIMARVIVGLLEVRFSIEHKINHGNHIMQLKIHGTTKGLVDLCCFQDEEY